MSVTTFEIADGRRLPIRVGSQIKAARVDDVTNRITEIIFGRVVSIDGDRVEIRWDPVETPLRVGEDLMPIGVDGEDARGPT